MASGQRVAMLPRRLATNPYCDLLSEHLEKFGVEVVDGRSGVRWLLAARRRVRVLHFHWPERHFQRGRLESALGFAARLLLARALGYRLVWTVHNLGPHEGTTLGDRCVRATLRGVATLVVHCASARRALGRAGAGAFVIPHGNYLGRYPNGIGRAAARIRLGLDPESQVLLAFGQVRPYKGLGGLCRAFTAVDVPTARLLIAGEPVAGGEQALAAVTDPRIRVVPRHVPDGEVQVFFNAADWVVFAYRDVLTSGAAMLAFSFGRGIVAPRRGCLGELGSSGAAILYGPDEPDALAEALRRALASDATAAGERAARLARAASWDTIARRHLAAYGLMPVLRLHAGRRPLEPLTRRDHGGWT
jgi:glycosyltransferase involved in cell wall biosynthesis